MKTLMFSVTLKDCRVETFCAGGKGGQNQNKVESGVRVTHEPSGATAEARDSRDQPRNKKQAFLRMVERPEFKRWLRSEAARRMGQQTPEDRVEEWTRPDKLRVEVRNGDRWVSAPPTSPA